MPPNRRFTQQDTDRLAERYNHGEKLRDLANELGITRQRVHQLLQRSSVYKPRPQHR